MTIERYLDSLRPKRRETARRIYSLVCEDGTLTTEKIAENLEMSSSAVAVYLSEMKECGLIKREGTTKGGRWVICDSLS